ASALAALVHGDKPLLLPPDPPRSSFRERPERGDRPERFDRPERNERPARSERPARGSAPALNIPASAGTETFRVEVGHVHKVKPGNLVGAIANEAGLEARHIGRIDIRGDHS